MRTRIRRALGRIRSQNGFSLAELLATMAVLLLVGTLIATGLPAARKAYTSAVDAANAEVLLATAIERFRNVLMVADANTVRAGESPSDDLEDGVTLVLFRDVNTGFDVRLYQDGEGIVIKRILPDGTELQEEPERLVPRPLERGAAGSYLVRFGKDGGIAWDADDDLFTLYGLEVVREGEGESVAKLEGDVSIRTVVGG